MSKSESIRIQFKDATGKIIEGKSEPQIVHSGIKLKLVAYAPCKIHLGQSTQVCGCTPEITAMREGPSNLFTKVKAQMVMALVLAATQTIKDTTNTGRSIANGATSSTLKVVAGTGTSAADVADYDLQAQSAGASGSQDGTVNAYSGSGTSGSFTVTATITNGSGSTIQYSEVGVKITIGGNVFLLSHDVFTALSVSNNGTLAVTYTWTYQ